jgi:hypothetical protein
MTVRVAQDGTVWLVDDCLAEEADQLLQHLLRGEEVSIDWSLCSHAHTSVIQVLLAGGRVPTGTPKDVFLGALIGPALARAHQAAKSAFPGRQGGAK